MGWASQVVLVVKNLPANAGDASLIFGSGRSPGAGNGNPLAWRISWTGGPQSMGSQSVVLDLVHTYTHAYSRNF